MSSLQDLVAARRASRGIASGAGGRVTAGSDARSAASGTSTHRGALPTLPAESQVMIGHPAVPSVGILSPGPRSTRSLQEYLADRRRGGGPPGSQAGSVMGGSQATTESTRALMEELKMTKEALRELREGVVAQLKHDNEKLRKETTEIKKMLQEMVASNKRQT